MATFKIVTLPGDGIGPDIVREAVKVMNRIGELYGHTFDIIEKRMGGIAIDMDGTSLPQDTIDAALASDAVLLGAVGGPKWDHLTNGDRPEKGLLGIRGALKLYANLRPAVLYKQLQHTSPLKPEIIGEGLDILVVRELTGGMYFGEKANSPAFNPEKPDCWASDLEKYSVFEIERILRTGFECARKRQKKLCCVHKANVLESSRLWRAVFERVKNEYPDIETSEMYVDNCAMQLVRNPRQFDVIVTSNIFGDILTDEASQVAGSIGMLASASLGAGKLGLYEPIHGSAPDIAGKNLANPLATILSVPMLFRYSLGLTKEAEAIEAAVNAVLDAGWRTGDIKSKDTPEDKIVGTKEMGDLVVAQLK
ncbi:MAG: 3-isopropylmalate dehydrogenase [Anaeroplasma sp.]|uniref:3-isopropylmalate dehydrogenase n=1 Tax=Anaeroplasma sp. TaxID=1872523 RepID=UPI002A9105FE|nr:3-isopropylmalate dehydrogenase [Anaeroplasma sp.]MDY5982401.1 3-isopropylmalate dehydrogenase [Anaeroplasma sp.]